MGRGMKAGRTKDPDVKLLRSRPCEVCTERVARDVATADEVVDYLFALVRKCVSGTCDSGRLGFAGVTVGEAVLAGFRPQHEPRDFHHLDALLPRPSDPQLVLLLLRYPRNSSALNVNPLLSGPDRDFPRIPISSWKTEPEHELQQ